jgi:hypothetical protein
MIKRIRSVTGNVFAVVLVLMTAILLGAFFLINYERLPK